MRDFGGPQDWAGKKFAVLGLARSGLALAKVFRSFGADVLLSDQRPASQMGSLVEEASALGATVELGGHSSKVLEVDALVISPGVSLYSEWVQKAFLAGTPVAGEVEIAARICRLPLVGITGTNGKSTTCSLLHEALGARSRLAGNIGLPLVSEVSQEWPGVDYMVAEISSFQLETVHSLRPRLAMLTNLSEDHLDRHRTMKEYGAAKARLFAYQEPSDWAIFNADDEGARQICQEVRAGKFADWPHFPKATAKPRDVLTYSAHGPVVGDGIWYQDDHFWLRIAGQAPQSLLRWDFANLPGPHNLSNALAAALAGHLLGVSAEQLKRAFSSYQRMHHRLEQVAQLGGIRFVDDSKATNISSVESALLTYKDPVVLIAGGRDKGLDLNLLAQVVAKNCHSLVVIGEAGPAILEHSIAAGLQRGFSASSLDEAVGIALKNCPDPGVILLSPACTSFDMFLNAEHRGDQFAISARQWVEKASLLAKEER